MSTEKEAFISSEDRPHVGGINPDTTIAELKVRDLRELLAGVNPIETLPILKVTNDKHWIDTVSISKLAHDLPIQTDPRGIGPDPEINKLVH